MIMRITGPGKSPGYVTGTLNLHSDDTLLRAIWENAEKNIPESLFGCRERHKVYLTGNGYEWNEIKTWRFSTGPAQYLCSPGDSESPSLTGP